MNLPSQIILGSIFMMVIVGAGLLFLAQGGDANNSEYQDFNASFNKISQIESASATMSSSLQSSGQKESVWGYLDTFASIAWTTLTGLFTTLSFLLGTDGILWNITKIFGVPTFLAIMGISALTFIVVFAIVGAFWRVKL
jgi:hypothetical protein